MSPTRKKEAYWEAEKWSEPNPVRKAPAIEDIDKIVEAIFDPDWYIFSSNSSVSRAQAFAHYCQHGWRKGLSPSPYFDVRWYLERYKDVRRARTEPLNHYVRHGEREGRKPHPLFDPAWYRDSYLCKSLDSDQNALAHFATVGKKRNARPHPLFWSDWYKKKYRPRLEPFRHYLFEGWRTLSPNPVFDVDYYRREAQIDAAINPLIHYVWTGSRAHLSPHPLFDPSYYERRAGHIPNNMDSLSHCLTIGSETPPHPLFDPIFYRRQAGPELKFDHALVDFIERGAVEGFSPHAFFATSWYLRRYPEARATGVNPLVHYLTAYEKAAGMRASLVSRLKKQRENSFRTYFSRAWSVLRIRRAVAKQFDALFYLFQNPDVLEAGIDPISHYLKAGWREGRWPARHFDPTYYLSNNPDVAQSGIEPFFHFIEFGQKEGRSGVAPGTHNESSIEHALYRSPHPLFNAKHYLHAYPDVARAGVNPLVHYLRSGFEEGRRCRSQEKPIRYAKRARLSPIDLPTARSLLGQAPSAVSGRKGVFAHIFYDQLAEEMVRYCNNVPAPCEVFITTDVEKKADAIAEAFRAGSVHPFEIRIAPNRGRDIAPMLVTFADKLKEVEFGVHVHTKRSTHYPRSFDAWRQYLLDSNLGSPQLVENILRLFGNEQVGAVAPADFQPIEHLIQWGGNLPTIQSLLDLVGERVNQDVPLEMPTGSMFWFRTAALRPLFDLGLDFFHFEPEEGQIDGTLAHAIERSFFFFVEIAGYNWIRFRAVDGGDEPGDFDLSDLESRFMRILPRQRDEISKHFPECTLFAPRASLVDRPRVNLLLPTIEQIHAYAGVFEALRFFDRLQIELATDFDARMIATERRVTDQSLAPPGYRLAPLSAEEGPGINLVCDGTLRHSDILAVRAQDIFLASAWWNAAMIFELMNWQDATFGQSGRKCVYMVQDYEPGFHPWSTKYMLARSTYLQPQRTLPIFNTPFLREFFLEHGYYSDGVTYEPGINPEIARHIRRGAEKSRKLLIYMRPHSARNCIEFADAVMATAVARNPKVWEGWRFFAVGEDFDAAKALKCSSLIEVLGRLTLEEYGHLLSTASLGFSLMVSPHPSYPPLEMAEAGIRVLTNTYELKDLSTLHENIRSFEHFDVSSVAAKLTAMATEQADGWSAKPKVNWFFGGLTNLESVVKEAAGAIRAIAGPK
jgi:hypothetical protein